MSIPYTLFDLFDAFEGAVSGTMLSLGREIPGKKLFLFTLLCAFRTRYGTLQGPYTPESMTLSWDACSQACAVPLAAHARPHNEYEDVFVNMHPHVSTQNMIRIATYGLDAAAVRVDFLDP